MRCNSWHEVPGAYDNTTVDFDYDEGHIDPHNHYEEYNGMSMFFIW